MTRTPWACPAVLLLALAAGGCVASPEVKVASTEMTAALAELQSAAGAFGSLYVAEVEATRAEIGKAIVARAVRNRVEELSGDFGKPEWEEQFKQRGLISLSEEIEIAQDTARRQVAEVSKIALGRGEAARDGVRKVLQRQVESLRISAAQMRKQGLEAVAKTIEATAADLEGADRLSDDVLIQAYFESLVELGAMKAEIPENLKDLDALIGMLRSTHAVVHDWVMTDVKVSGAKIAGLLEKHAKPLGLAAPAPPGATP